MKYLKVTIAMALTIIIYGTVGYGLGRLAEYVLQFFK